MILKKKLFKFILFGISLSLISCKSQKIEQRIFSLTLEQFKFKVIGKNVQLIDVRTPKEYQAGYIDDAFNINFYDRDFF